MQDTARALDPRLQAYGIHQLFHMTDLQNLPSILKNGLLSHHQAHAQGIVRSDISDPSVQLRRARRVDPINRCFIHDYACLYFNPRNPMLYRRRELQNQIVLVGVDASILLGQKVVFTDGNAASNDTCFYQGIENLDNLPWRVIWANSWIDFCDGKRQRCAEVLVPQQVDSQFITRLYCRSHSTAQQVLKMLPAGSKITVWHAPELFF